MYILHISYLYKHKITLNHNLYFSVLLDINVPSPDIDECKIVPSVCHSDADCTDSDGSYECTCKEGYSGNERLCTGIYLSYEIHGVCNFHNFYLSLRW